MYFNSYVLTIKVILLAMYIQAIMILGYMLLNNYTYLFL